MQFVKFQLNHHYHLILFHIKTAPDKNFVKNQLNHHHHLILFHIKNAPDKNFVKFQLNHQHHLILFHIKTAPDKKFVKVQLNHHLHLILFNILQMFCLEFDSSSHTIFFLIYVERTYNLSLDPNTMSSTHIFGFQLVLNICVQGIVFGKH